MAHSWGIAPSEIWGMTMAEWFLLYEHHRPRQKGDYAGNLTRADVDRLSALIGKDNGAPSA